MDVNIFMCQPVPQKTYYCCFPNHTVVTNVSTSWIMFRDGLFFFEGAYRAGATERLSGWVGRDKVQEKDNRIQGLHPFSRLCLQAKVGEPPTYIKI